MPTAETIEVFTLPRTNGISEVTVAPNQDSMTLKFQGAEARKKIKIPVNFQGHYKFLGKDIRLETQRVPTGILVKFEVTSN